jgi:hypothetical protein
MLCRHYFPTFRDNGDNCFVGDCQARTHISLLSRKVKMGLMVCHAGYYPVDHVGLLLNPITYIPVEWARGLEKLTFSTFNEPSYQPYRLLRIGDLVKKLQFSKSDSLSLEKVNLPNARWLNERFQAYHSCTSLDNEPCAALKHCGLITISISSDLMVNSEFSSYKMC